MQGMEFVVNLLRGRRVLLLGVLKAAKSRRRLALQPANLLPPMVRGVRGPAGRRAPVSVPAALLLRLPPLREAVGDIVVELALLARFTFFF